MNTFKKAYLVLWLYAWAVPAGRASPPAGGGAPMAAPGPAAIGKAALERYSRALAAAREKPGVAFDGKPSAFLQNFDMDSILNSGESPDDPYLDMKGRRYAGLQPDSMGHPKTGVLRSAGITLLTPVLVPVVTSAAYLSRKLGPGSVHPPQPPVSGVKGFVQKVANIGFKIATGLVFAPFAGLCYGLFVVFPQRVVQTAERAWGALTGKAAA